MDGSEVSAPLYGLLALLAASAAEPPTIRVLLAEDAQEVWIATDAPAAIFRGESAQPLWRGGSLPRTRIAPAPSGLLVGESEIRADRLRFATARLWEYGEQQYAGVIEVARDGDGLRVINEVDFERYVMGVVGPEIGAGAPAAALEAQAVAARTYAWCRKRDRASAQRDFDVHADTRDQVYHGDPGRGSAAERAVERTRGVLLAWRGEPFPAYFHSTCGGRTRSVAEWSPGTAEIPPLAGVECAFCDGTRYSTWSVDVDAGDLGDWVQGRLRELAVARTSPRSGYPLEIRIVSNVTRTVSADEFRRRLGTEQVRSPFFTVRRQGDGWIVEGHGWGHGVGMCQMGAIGLARRGRRFEDILAHYYPGAELVRRW
jgi:stage II sporulation protein D